MSDVPITQLNDAFSVIAPSQLLYVYRYSMELPLYWIL